MSNPRFLTITGLILAAALSRLVPHPWNVTPVAAVALFGGVHFADKRLAFLVPFAALIISDLFLGWHATLPFVYFSFAIMVGMGWALRNRVTFASLATATLVSSILFFLITNFGHWLVSAAYAKSFPGLMACYTAAIPWFRNTVAGDAFYTGVIFGAFALAERRFPALREATAH